MYSSSDERGQATVEAAFLIPVLFLVMLMVLQPAILLYDRMVMESAAAEGCRLLMTDAGGADRRVPVGGITLGDDAYEDYVRRRLGAIPPIPIFHLHEDGCSYEIEMTGDETSAEVSVTIRNRVRLLPLIGQVADAVGRAEGGICTQEVQVHLPGRPDWVQGTPEEWAAAWE